MKKVRIAVGTKNPCKIDAVRSSFLEYFSSNEYELIITPKDIPSGVRDQPFGDDETRSGAINRARGAYESGEFDFGVGLEGGIEIIERSGSDKKDLWCMAFMCIIGSTSETCTSCRHTESTFLPNITKQQELRGVAKTASFPLCNKISDLVINDKMELGDADDEVFQRVNSKHGDGTVGKLTKGIVPRSDYYDHALKLALIPFSFPELYLVE